MIKVAIIGAGKMARHHARAIARLEGLAMLVGVSDPDDTALDAMSTACPEAKVFSDPSRMISAVEPDVVHVCTPPATHVPLAELAFGFGCHVYVEKPVAGSVGEIDRLLRIADERSLQLCPGHQLLYERPARETVQLLPALREIVHVESYFSFRPSRGGEQPLTAIDQLLDVLPHPVYLLLHFLNSEAAETEVRAVEVGPRATVHALVRRGGITGTLCVSLEGRPVESFVRVVGTYGTLLADFVRGTVQHLIGPGASTPDKILNPYRIGMQQLSQTTRALARRFASGQRSYPGLAELFEAFYRSIRDGTATPVTASSTRSTVKVCEVIAGVLEAGGEPAADGRPNTAPGSDMPLIVVTGGTGFLGREVVRSLRAHDIRVRVVARRLPPAWEREHSVEYRVHDLAEPLPADLCQGATAVAHCAAATAGGQDAHRRNSIEATRNIIEAAAAAGVSRLVHVSSIAVLDSSGNRPISEDTRLEGRADACGPYVWGKLESERLASRLGVDRNIEIRVVRPGALIDRRNFDPPGRLGRRIGGLFVAVGPRRQRLGVIDVSDAGSAIAWLAMQETGAPERLNLLASELPTRARLVRELRRSDPRIRVIWLPRFALAMASGAFWLLSKLRRTQRIDLLTVFGSPGYDTSRMAALTPEIEAWIGHRQASRR